MAEKVTLVGPSGDSITTDNPETINNYQFGRGYRVMPAEEAKPASRSATRNRDSATAEASDTKK